MKYLIISKICLTLSMVMFTSCGPKEIKNIKKFSSKDESGLPKVYDQNGYDEDGFNIQGYNREGFNIYGFDEKNFNKNGMTIYGHNAWGLGEENDQVEVINYAKQQYWENLTYSAQGIDQLGYFRQLPHAHIARDERFHTDSFNRHRENFLGLKEKNFNEKSYEAILDLDIVKNYPQDLPSLVDRFNQSCFQMELFSEKEYFMEKLDSKNFMEILYEYNSKINDDFIGYFLNDRMKKNNDIISMSRELENELINHFKKSIYFCEYFLFSDSLKPHSINFSHLKLDKKSRFIVDKEMGVDYDMWFKVVSKGRPLNYLNILENELKKNEVLQKSFYDDNNIYNKRIHLEAFFRAYRTNDVLNPEQAKLYLYILARRMPNFTLEEKANIAGVFIHGGANCRDAKRLAVVLAFMHHARDDYNKIIAIQKIIYSENSLEASIKSHLLELKKDKLSKWISDNFAQKEESTGAHLDWASGFPAVWNMHNSKLGLNSLGNFHTNFNYPLDFNYFFESDKDNDKLSGHDVTLRGGFTKEAIYYKLYPKTKSSQGWLEPNDIRLLVDIKKQIFGPLWNMIDNRKTIIKEFDKPFSRGYPAHPIMDALLVRLGVFTT